jgi:hypothetical protein
MKKIFTLILILTVCFDGFSQSFKVDTIYKSGSIERQINVLILGDGFSQAEMPRFTEQAKNFADFFLAYDPYDRYRNYFNFFSIPTPSKESGVTNPGSAPDAYPDQPIGKKDTYYGATFGSSIHRLVTITKFDVLSNVLALNFPTADLVVMLVNTPFYGGSGGGIAVHTLHSSANTIGAHEIGHTFSFLNDEYWAGPQYGWEAANMTADSNAETVKWKKWLNEANVGIFQHGDGEAARWFKPTSANCLMEYLDKQFCAVCREATTERILQLVSPITAISPDTATEAILSENARVFALDLLKPDPNTLQVAWTLDGEIIKTGSEEISLTADDLTSSTGLLTATVFDSTSLSRRETARSERSRTVQWRLASRNAPLVFKLKVSDPNICPGEFTTLTASGCAGTVNWSTGQTGNTIEVSPVQNTDYSATCKVAGQPDSTLKTTITVFAKPEATASNKGPYFEKATIELDADGGLFYFWTGPDNFLSQAKVSLIENATIKNAGVYHVRVIDANGCSDTASTEVKVDRILGVEDPAKALVLVSPNPAKGFVTVKTKIAGESVFTIFDIKGRKLLDRQFQRDTEINLNGRSSGMYLYKFTNGDKETSGKFLIE